MFYQVKLKRVIDGDTFVVDIYLGLNIWLNDQRIRILNLDAPEIRGTNKVEGLRVKSYAEEILKDKTLTIETEDDKRDSFGRLLAHLYVENKNYLNLLDICK